MSSRNEIVNSLLLIQESKMTRTRDRSQDAKNINRRKQVFEVFTSRVSSQFERVEMKTAIINNEEILSRDVITHNTEDCGSRVLMIERSQR